MLVDRFGRVHDYLRIAVTDRCNFRCTYCMPEGGIALGHAPAYAPTLKADLLTFEEIAGLAEIFVRLGVRKIRLTGGEPLVRHGIENLFAMLSPLDVELALSTNGSLLAEKLDTLWKHRFYQLNISLDTLRPDRFAAITGRDACEDVQRAIRSAAAYRSGHAPTLDQSFESVKINMVVMRGINDDELLDFVRFGEELSALARGGPAVEIRYIEFMPFQGNAWGEERCVPLGEMLPRIQSEYDLRAIESNEVTPGPAKSFRVASSNLRLGFITTVSEPFCGECSRLRLTADGTLRTCLFGEDGVNMRDMLRDGASFETMADAIASAVQEKWIEHPPVHELAGLNTREMIAIGG